MKKSSVAQLGCLVANLQGQLARVEKQIMRLEARDKQRTIAYLRDNDISTLNSIPKGYENLSAEAKIRADASLQRRMELRNRNKNLQDMRDAVMQ